MANVTMTRAEARKLANDLRILSRPSAESAPAALRLADALDVADTITIKENDDARS